MTENEKSLKVTEVTAEKRTDWLHASTDMELAFFFARMALMPYFGIDALFNGSHPESCISNEMNDFFYNQLEDLVGGFIRLGVDPYFIAHELGFEITKNLDLERCANSKFDLKVFARQLIEELNDREVLSNARAIKKLLGREFDIEAYSEHLPDKLKAKYLRTIARCYDNPEEGEKMAREYLKKLFKKSPDLIVKYIGGILDCLNDWQSFTIDYDPYVIFDRYVQWYFEESGYKDIYCPYLLIKQAKEMEAAYHNYEEYEGFRFDMGIVYSMIQKYRPEKLEIPEDEIKYSVESQFTDWL